MRLVLLKLPVPPPAIVLSVKENNLREFPYLVFILEFCKNGHSWVGEVAMVILFISCVQCVLDVFLVLLVVCGMDSV